MRSGGICWFRFCWMPTFFNPGGRTLGGGDIMPLPMPWAQAAPASSAMRSAIPRKPVTIEFTNCFVLHTAEVLSFARSGFSLRCFGGLLLYRCGSLRLGVLRRGALCGGALWRRCAFLMNRQAALRDQLHGAVDRNPHRTSVLIQPVVGGKLPVLILDE